MARLKGYNVALQLGGKTVLGRTQEDLTISARIKESITKDDLGETQKEVVGHDVSFKVAALAALNASSSTQTTLSRDEVIEMSLKTGDDAKISIKYVGDTGAAYTGSAIITGCTESSGAEAASDVNLSIDLQVVGALTKASS